MRSLRSARGFTLLELMIVTAILAIIAAVAIPSFLKYLRRSKSSEALLNLRKMWDGAASYFYAEHASATGAPVAKQFPGWCLPGCGGMTISGPTGTSPCCNPPAGGGGGKCIPSAAYWTIDITWAALSFSVDDPFYYRYQYSVSGTDKASQFTAAAYGDLNCNGVESLYERLGSIDAKFGVTGGAGVHIVNDLE